MKVSLHTSSLSRISRTADNRLCTGLVMFNRQDRICTYGVSSVEVLQTSAVATGPPAEVPRMGAATLVSDSDVLKF